MEENSSRCLCLGCKGQRGGREGEGETNVIVRVVKGRGWVGEGRLRRLATVQAIYGLGMKLCAVLAYAEDTL